MMDLKRVAAHWDASEWAQGIPKDYWGHHPLIRAYIGATIAPHASNMLDWLAKNFLKDGPRERALSVCCGLGAGDRQALTAGVCSNLEGFDISPASIKSAQAEADRAGMDSQAHYWVDDANTITLEKERYDVAFSFGGLHHVEALEHLCDQLRQALKPDSLILVNEFVGPARFQWTEQQLDMINRVAAVLPPEWCRTRWVKPIPPEEVIAADPSEAVRSDEVVSVLCNSFELIDYCDYGGGLLMPLWQYVTLPDVFMQNQVDKQVIIKLLILMDELLAEHGIVSSNYAQLVLRNRRPLSDRTVQRRLSVQSSARDEWNAFWLPGIIFDGPSVKKDIQDASPAHWWQLPGKALRILHKRGPRAMVTSTLTYFRRRLLRS